MRRQRSETRRPPGRLIEADGLQRAQVDAIFVSLARMLLPLSVGSASVGGVNTGAANPRTQGNNAPTNAPTNAAANAPTNAANAPPPTNQPSSVMAARITPEALNTVNQVQLSESEAGQLQQIIANQPTLADILKSNVTLSNAMMAALVYAAEAMG